MRNTTSYETKEIANSYSKHETLTQSRTTIKNIQITKRRRPLTAKNVIDVDTYDLASEREVEAKRSKPRPKFSHPAERENGEIIRKATALKMDQSNPGPKTRKLVVKLIDITKYPTVPVPTRRETLSTNINRATELPVTNSTPAKPKVKKAVNVKKDRPIFIDLTFDENATLSSQRIPQIKTKENAEQCKDGGTAKKQTKAAFTKKKKAEEESFTESSESETSEDISVQSDSDPWKTVPVESDVSEKSGHEPEFFESDHEFSAESDDESQFVPTERARTAHNNDESKIEDKWYACQKCKMHNNPESILLCDECDKGYHCSCLVPMLFTIPEGVWFCPQCQQEKLIKSLENLLKQLDKGLIRQKALQTAKKFDEIQRQKREKFDEIKRQKREKFASLSMLPDEPDEDERVRKKLKRKRTATSRYLRSNVASGSSSGSSPTGSSNSCSDNKPVYKLRERGQTNVNYRFKEGSDTSEDETKSEGKTKGASDSVPKPTQKTQKRDLRKKSRKLNSSDSEDDGSDDDFRGTSCSEDDSFSAGSGNDN